MKPLPLNCFTIFPLILLLLLLTFPSFTSSVCVPYEGDFCHDYIRDPNVAASASNQLLANTVLSSLGWENLTTIMNVLDPECSRMAQAFICNNFFPPCDIDDNPVPICQQTCIDFKDVCKTQLNSSAAAEVVGFLPDCATFKTQDCTTLDFVPPVDASKINCPAPLIPNTDRSKKRANCPGDYCCIPCPVSHHFYLENEADNMMIFLNVTGGIFFFFSLVVMITYFALPAKRTFPQLIIGQLMLAIFIGYLPLWINIFGGRDVYCNSPVEQADYTNSACVAQAFLIFLFLWAMLMWFLVLAFNIFLVLFLKVEVGKVVAILYHIVGWGIPLIIVIYLAAKKNFAFTIIAYCGMTNSDGINVDDFSFSPFAAMLLLTAAFVIASFCKVAHIARTSKHGVMAILKLQARPLALTTFFLLLLMAYWIFFKITPLVAEDYYNEWFICIALGRGQNECSPILTKHLPTLAAIGVVYFFISLLGLFGFLLFFLKKDVYDGWKDLLSKSPLAPCLSKYISWSPKATLNSTYQSHQSRESQQRKRTETSERASQEIEIEIK